MNLIISHPTGNTNVRAVASALLKENLLLKFHTSIAVFPGSFLEKLSSLPYMSQIKRRQYDAGLKNFTHTFPWKEWGRIISQITNIQSLTEHEKGFYSIDAIYQNIDNNVAHQLKKIYNTHLKAIYTYEDCAYLSFLASKALGIECFYELPTGYWRAAKKLLEREQDRWPDWFPTITGFNDSETKLQRKDHELSLADRIYVASNFTAETLKDYPGKLSPIDIIPYGFPNAISENQYHRKSHIKKIKILFVGKLTQQKGIADLFAVANKIQSQIELTIVGRKAIENCRALDKEIAKHTWIDSLPHYKILELMRNQDLLVFPSLFEGFGLVITEAMSQGLPVITTNRTAGPDLITHGSDGWIVEAGSTEALMEAIERCISNPSMLAEVGREALRTAEKRPWNIYQTQVAKSIKDHLHQKQMNFVNR